MTETETPPTQREAFEQLRDNQGQSYILSTEAAKMLYPFYDVATVAFVAERVPYDEEELENELPPDLARSALYDALADKQVIAREARGMVSVPAFQPIVTYQDVSELLVEAMEGEPSESQMLGTGSTSDVRHESNVSWLAERLGYEAAEQ